MSKLNWTKANKVNQALNHGGFEPVSNELRPIYHVCNKKQSLSKTTHGVYSDCSCRGAKWHSDPKYFMPTLKKKSTK